jgi:hypothetical protein
LKIPKGTIEAVNRRTDNAMAIACLFVIGLLAIVLHILLLFTALDYPFGIFKFSLCIFENVKDNGQELYSQTRQMRIQYFTISVKYIAIKLPYLNYI